MQEFKVLLIYHINRCLSFKSLWNKALFVLNIPEVYTNLNFQTVGYCINISVFKIWKIFKFEVI